MSIYELYPEQRIHPDDHAPRTSSVHLPTQDAIKGYTGVAGIKPITPMVLTDQQLLMVDLKLTSDLIKLWKAHRKQIGRTRTVANNAHLRLSARWKGIDMAGYMYMAHDDPPEPRPPTAGRGWYQRVGIDSGYSAGNWQRAAGENLAYAFLTAQTVFNAWMSDDGHRQNLEADWTDFGFACVRASNGLLFWSQDFGIYAS